ncbi:hypothetical protein [Plantactinospora sp. BB1]|uniref:hypothetical protein n=1 Tax=Plantactinospora sp. BB1 TaxID=2071627 RepID=UPI000D1616CA|nr:hypothetical protein [Plantactinospora sp. BB1]AVT39387.1 hypothetical protein C6W10_26410 [Plantactinospora sp. BB1]
MKVTEENPGEWVAVLEMPLAPEELTELAGKVPAEAVCTDVEQDGDRLYMRWEVPRVEAIN